MIDNDNNKTINSAFDEIIPANGARERMLANIKRKAKAKNPRSIAVKLAKLAMPIAACLVIAVIAAVEIKTLPTISQGQETSEPAKVGSNVRFADSAAVFTEELGITINAPEGSKNVQYRIIDNEIADISFVYHGINYTLRASEKSGDFSGINGTAVLSELIGDDCDNGAVLTAVENFSSEAFLKLEWNAGKTKYFLCCPDNEANGNSPDIKNSGFDSYSRTKAAENIVNIYNLIK